MNLKRREFIRLSGLTIAGTVILPPFLQSCNGGPLSQSASGYLDHFEVTPELLQKVVQAAMEKGAGKKLQKPRPTQLLFPTPALPV